MNAPLRCGSTVVVLPRFDLAQFLEAIQTHRITGLYVAPPIVLALAKHPLVGSTTCRRCGTSSAPPPRSTPSWRRRVRPGWGCRRCGRRTG